MVRHCEHKIVLIGGGERNLAQPTPACLFLVREGNCLDLGGDTHAEGEVLCGDWVGEVLPVATKCNKWEGEVFLRVAGRVKNSWWRLTGFSSALHVRGA